MSHTRFSLTNLLFLGKTRQGLSGTVSEAQGGGQPYLPEPLDNGVVWAVTVLVDCVLSPVVNINVAKATHQ